MGGGGSSPASTWSPLGCSPPNTSVIEANHTENTIRGSLALACREASLASVDRSATARNRARRRHVLQSSHAIIRAVKEFRFLIRLITGYLGINHKSNAE